MSEWIEIWRKIQWKKRRRTFRTIQMDHPKVRKEFVLSLYIRTLNEIMGPACIAPYALIFGELSILRSFLKWKIHRSIPAKRRQTPFTTRQIMVEAQAKSKSKGALIRQESQIEGHVYLSCDKALVWQEKIVKNRNIDFRVSFSTIHIDARSKIFSI